MKHLSTFLSILSLALIAILFYLHFSQKPVVKTTSPAIAKAEGPDFRIAYFDIDSLQTHFDYFKKVSNEMKARENAMTISREHSRILIRKRSRNGRREVLT